LTLIQDVPPFRKLNEGKDEPILEPDLPIIDSHHHLFDRSHLRYMIEDYLADTRLGHNIVATVYIETQAMARPSGPEPLRPIGEIEFANGVGAMCASGTYGACQVAAAIVGFADMQLGDRVAETLDRAMQVAPDRFRGVRQIALSHPNPQALRFLTHLPPEGLLNDPAFLHAFRQLAPRNLTFDTAVLHHQLPELSALAAGHPDTTIVLDHVGLAMMRLETDPQVRSEVFRIWREKMAGLARNPNVYCKIGGLGTSY
jgi:L-fuconolactonase